MFPRTLFGLVLGGLFLAGCAAPEMPPVAADHPAHPDAPAAPAPQLSQTLALHDRQPMTGPATAPAAYTCLHHPDVVSSQPGDCPKCGMALSPRPATRPAPAHDHSGRGGHGGHP